MKHIVSRRAGTTIPALFICVFQFVAQTVFSQNSDFLSAEEFVNRRAAVLEQMADSSVAVFQAANVKTRSNDVEFEYRQDSNFYYLTGISDPNTILVLVKEGVKLDNGQTLEILFFQKRHPRMSGWLGKQVIPETAEKRFGFKHVRSSDAFRDMVRVFLDGKKVLYYNFEPDFLYEPVSDERFFLGRQVKKNLKKKYPGLKVKSPAKILTALRQIKSPAETELMQKAVDITCQAHMEVMRSARPGLYEYQLEAIIEYVFKYHGAEHPAFPSIVGSGPNTSILHHWKNRRKTKNGELVVLDIGAEYSGYSADVSRTIPINGEFSEKQREIYEIVLQAQKAAIAAVKPGVPFRDVHKVAKKVIDDAGYAKYFTHGTSHYLGLDTHDVGDYGLLKAGMVITVEPGIYIAEGAEVDKSYWNIGIRIEDDVLVTENGHEILSKSAPKEIQEIEKLMKEESRISLTFKR
ncbi:M24 family metallopeptidase [candidate division KSB1 bacterium]|nr:M24 family metallopeptidase [candidate division KSB1 bacterium]NIR70180.1 M24 family metallopeptidase [candidate division KSB1 bacterium]NIS27567.1 M24 family metallopeptidase [candidate division KSB1 bacterium]NIT74419.1 M24 family metallopeptidase [candidate division KSB1 bacterium]NIU28284.1 M24 family metallopeptidase [candidate division KSB1 bacterium]